MGLLLETFSRNGSVSKVIPAWCSFLRRDHANRRRDWRFRSRRDSWPWCRQLQWRVAGAWTRQFDWRVEGCAVPRCRLFPTLQSATCDVQFLGAGCRQLQWRFGWTKAPARAAICVAWGF